MVRSLDMNPVYQNLRISLSQADADLAEMRGQIASQQAVVADLRSRVNTIPEVEAELVRLNRDYEVNKTQYDTLLQRLESARISESAEQNTESVKFRVIEPPTVPVKPSGPARLMLDSLVLLAALGAGLGLAILVAQMHPTFTTRDLLQKVTGIRVLGAVTAAVRGDVVPWYRRQSLLVGGAMSLLLMTYLLNLVLSDSLRSVIRNVLG
jgi:polysaccharide chain length determinant protein (PEP-CTERM system associated)